MAVRATAGFGILRYEPGNPEFPTLPDGVIVPHFIALDRTAGFRGGRVVEKNRVFAAAPDGDHQRYAAWQTDTTWIQPAVIDFGVITAPIQRRISLYNARFTSVDVTAVDFGTTGVSLVTPTLTQTLQPYAGIDFTIEAGIDGPADFDEFVTFTTAEGPISFRVIGRRILSLNLVPEAPLVETLRWRTDVLRSTNGSEKAYSLLQSPNSIVDYNIRFTDDLARIKFRNQIVGGESALVVGAQKWWEATRVEAAVNPADTVVRTEYPTPAFWTVDRPISIVSNDGSVSSNQTVQSITVGPDPYIENVVILARFDGPDGSTEATNLIDGTPWTMLFGTQIDTAQSKFGGASLLCSTLNPGFNAGGAQIPYNANMDAPTDMTLDLWFRPTATDLSANNTLASRWYSLDPGSRSWRLDIASSGANLLWEQREGSNTRQYFFPTGGLVADTWYYLRVSKIGGTIRMGLDGVEIGTGVAQVASPNEGDIRFIIGDYYDSGFTKDFKGHIDDVRFTAGVGRAVDEAAPTAPHPSLEETYLELNTSTAIGETFAVGDFVMPVGLGYISRLPTYSTFPVNVEDAKYQVTINQDPYIGELPASFPLLNGVPILEIPNMVTSGTVQTTVQRREEVIDSKLSNRVAFSRDPFSDEVQAFHALLTSREQIREWKQLLSYLRGSYGQIYVPSFGQDFPDVVTTASNVFNMTDTDYAVLFGTTTPADRRGALRFEYDDGTILYRNITQVVDNGALEQFTVDGALQAGTPRVSYMPRSRIFGDTVTFIYERQQQAELRFRYRTIQE